MKLESLLDAIAQCRSPEAVGRALYCELQPWGAKAIYARTCRSGGREDNPTYSRISPPGWESLYTERNFSQANYVLKGVFTHVEPFIWSEVRTNSPLERDVVAALRDVGIDDGIAVPVYGPNRYVGVVSLAFASLRELSPKERRVIELAAYAAHAQMRLAGDPKRRTPIRLSPREADCLAYIAAGLSDAAISDKLKIAETTVTTHVLNARAKLGAKTRAQAVALALALDLF